MHKKNDIVRLIKILNISIEKRVNNDFKKMNLTMQQIKILLYLKEREKNTVEITTQKDIQNLLGVTHPTTISIIKSLEQKKFITSRHSEIDRRLKTLHLTENAYEMTQSIVKGKINFDNDLLRGIEKNELNACIKCLNKMYENINKS